MTVLMTGSHGFVGSNLIEALASTYNIIRWDAREDKPLSECDAVIHLAGLAHDTKNTIEAEKYFEVNTELTKKIFDRFLDSRAKKFIFFSSIKAQDNDTPYAKSKKQAEEYILDKVHSSWLKVNGCKKIYILRPCMIHGEGVKGNLPLLFKFVKKGWPWPLAAFENQRSYASMGNVNFVVSELLMKDVGSGTYNICDDEPVSTNKLIELMGECLGREAKLLKIPKGIIQLGSRIGDVLHMPLNTERLKKLTSDYVVDNSQIKHALGIDLMPIKVEKGLRYTIQEMMEI